MRFEFRLPDIGEGMVEGEIVKWHVKVGDKVAEDAPMLDLMTDKATVTIPAPKAGKIFELHGKEGEIVKVGSVLVVIETEGVAPEAKAPERAALSFSSVSAPPRDGEKEKILASPATRRLAQEMGVSLSRVAGTGPGGRITSEDVQHFAARGSAKTETRVATKEVRIPVSHPSESEERVPFRGLRRKIAERMLLSKTKAPHFTYVEEADVTELVALRDRADSLAATKGIRLTYLPFVVKAVVSALKKFPILNATLDEEKQEIVIKHYYHIGIAAATQEGLTVPVLKNADEKSFFQIAKEINELGDRARAGKLTLEELQGSTFTITSLGPLGGIFATPIIYYPEVAILGIHRIHKRPVVRNNQIVARDMMYLSLSFDHRVIDGDVGAKFANEIIQVLESPGLLALEL